jgi:hypothetical protein
MFVGLTTIPEAKKELEQDHKNSIELTRRPVLIAQKRYRRLAPKRFPDDKGTTMLFLALSQSLPKREKRQRKKAKNGF